MEQISKHEFEFEESTHTYWVDGIKVPSITQVMSEVLEDDYKNIPEEILKKASENGTRVHLAVETFERYGFHCKDTKVYENLKNWDCLENEMPIILEYKGHIFAGRMDMLVLQSGAYGIIDLKYTAKLHIDKLEHQLNLYRLGFQQTYGIDITFLLGVWLREEGKVVDIPINEELAYQDLDKYIDINSAI